MRAEIERPPLEDRILDRTEARLLEQGYRAMRVDELAHDLGISKRTLYEQFRSKQEMARRALERRFDRLVAAIEAQRDRLRDEVQQLREAVVLLSSAHAELLPAIERELADTPALAEVLSAGHERVCAEIDAIIQAGSSRGRFRRSLDGPLARRTILAIIDAACGPAALREDGRAPEQAAREAVDLLLCGLEP